MAKKSKVNPELATVKGSRKAHISKGGMIKGKANREKYLKEI